MKTRITQFLLSFLALFCLTIEICIAQYNSSEFINEIPIPYLATGTTVAGTTSIDLDFAATFHNFDPSGATSAGLPLVPGSKQLYKIDKSVRAWGINSSSRKPMGAPDMTYLGPTLLWKHGNMINMRVTNSLPTKTPTEPGEGQQTTSHWHGLNVHAQGDGGPHQAIPNTPGPDNPWNPMFPMVDPAQTLWYHSHVMEYTTEQVIMGLSGLIIVEDTTDALTVALNNALPHDYGENDFPLVIQDKRFVYTIDSLLTDTLHTADSMYVKEKVGDGEFRIINGVALGKLNVPNSMVRFRVLNGDSRKSFNIGFSTNIDTSDVASRLTFYQIASDGGYMGKAHPIQSFLVNPGERGEFVVDFSSAALGGATEVFLSNLSSDPAYAITKDIVGLGGDRKNGGPLNPGLAFMKFNVVDTLTVQNPIFTLPDSSMFPDYALQDCPSPRERTKNLLDSLENAPPGGMWTIDGTPMDMTVLNDTVCVNTCEEWTVINHTPVAHPFHIHKVQFQVKQYIDRSSGTPVTYDYPNLPAHMMGYKDVMIVRKNSQFTFQARFDMFGEDEIKPNNGYMYHCHILTHEDFSMMHQFTVVSDSVCRAVGLTSVKDPLGDHFSIYPNPAEDIIYLKGAASKPGTLRITDLMGRVIWEEFIPPFDGERRIHTHELPRGIILVNFRYENQYFTRKIILE